MLIHYYVLYFGASYYCLKLWIQIELWFFPMSKGASSSKHACIAVSSDKHVCAAYMNGNCYQ